MRLYKSNTLDVFLGTLVSVVDENKNQIHRLIYIYILRVSRNFHNGFCFELCSLYYQTQPKMINFDRFIKY